MSEEKNFQQTNKIYYDLMYIISCALKNETPVLDGIDLEKIRKEAIKDSIFPLIGKVIPEFQNDFLKNVYRNTNLENCRKNIYDFFDQKGIWHCSLKGIAIKDLYPNFAMRFLADYDILFDPKYKNEIRKWYAENNVKILYLRESRKGEKEDSIIVNNQFHFEMHYCLLNDSDKKYPWYNYFVNENLFKRLTKTSDYEYKMTNEDFYLFFLIHAYKHSSTVCDIRCLIDCYLINIKLPYNKEFVSQKLVEFGLTEYEKNVRTIGNKLINGEKLVESEEVYFIKCAQNNTFGDLELNELRKIAGNEEITEEVRKKAIINLFITNSDTYKIIHPIIYYSVVLRPIYHLLHIIVRLINWKNTKILIYKYKNIK